MLIDVLAHKLFRQQLLLGAGEWPSMVGWQERVEQGRAVWNEVVMQWGRAEEGRSHLGRGRVWRQAQSASPCQCRLAPAYPEVASIGCNSPVGYTGRCIGAIAEPQSHQIGLLVFAMV